ncbi:MAG: PAS domain-containing protein [Hyphomicrobiales bacterium]
MHSVTPKNVEVFFDKSEIIVSKTDLKGRITYANRTFARVAGYSEAELLGQPHSIIRHPDMPRAIFKFLWDTLAERNEVFAYVKNLARDGSYYWVFAHVTPSMDASNNVVGYHSNRRVPRRDVISNVIEPLYGALLAEENSVANKKEGLARSTKMLTDVVRSKARSYDELIFSL